MRDLNSGSPESSLSASTHWSSLEGSHPVFPDSIISTCTPTGFATTGKAAAWYCRILSPHLPRLHKSSGIQLMPTSQRAKSKASEASLQGTETTGIVSKLGNWSLMTCSDEPGTSRPTRFHSNRVRSKPCNVLAEPIHTKRTPE